MIDDLAGEVMRNLCDCPQYYLDMMAARYVKEFEKPVHKLALVTVELESGETAYYFTDVDELYE